MMKILSLWRVLFSVAGCALMAGCGSDFSPPPEKSGEKPFRVGLLSPGPVNDQGWNQVAYDALLRMKSELGAEVSFVEVEQSPAVFERAFRDYAWQGYDMVLGHGFEFQDAALVVAKDFPHTWFFLSSSGIHEGKVLGVDTDSSQPFYLMGVAAAKMSRKAGLVGGMEIPPISNAFRGFVNGTRSIDPNYPVNQTYIGSWTDAAAVKEAVISLMESGCDFILPHANAAGSGGYQALRERGAGVWTFGIYKDFTSQAPENVIGNYFNDYGQGLVNIARQVRAGSFHAKSNIVFGVGDEDVMRVTYREGKVPATVRNLLEETRRKIAAGEINTLAPLP